MFLYEPSVVFKYSFVFIPQEKCKTIIMCVKMFSLCVRTILLVEGGQYDQVSFT